MEKSIRIAQILGDKQEYYLGHSCKTIDKSLLYTPGPDVIEKVWMNSDRNLPTLNNMRRLLMQGRLANTGYVSILPAGRENAFLEMYAFCLKELISTRTIGKIQNRETTANSTVHNAPCFTGLFSFIRLPPPCSW